MSIYTTCFVAEYKQLLSKGSLQRATPSMCFFIALTRLLFLVTVYQFRSLKQHSVYTTLDSSTVPSGLKDTHATRFPVTWKTFRATKGSLSAAHGFFLTSRSIPAFNYDKLVIMVVNLKCFVQIPQSSKIFLHTSYKELHVC